MDTALLLSLLSFAFIGSITPGPNNLLLMSSGALFGLKKTVPHLSGILIGVAILNVSAVFGLAAIVDQWPWLVTVVRVVGAGWLAWMSIRFFQAAMQNPDNDADDRNKSLARPFRIYEAALFQWVNPKAVIIALSVSGAYIGLAESPLHRAMIIVLVFVVAGGTSCTAWTLAGDALNRYLSAGRSARYLNLGMGILIVLTALLILVGYAE